MRSFRVSVVIPALNEAENLRHVLPRIPSDVDEVILVDGGSVDGTVEVARSVMPSLRVISQEGRGKGAALRTGFHGRHRGHHCPPRRRRVDRSCRTAGIRGRAPWRG